MLVVKTMLRVTGMGLMMGMGVGVGDGVFDVFYSIDLQLCNHSLLNVTHTHMAMVRHWLLLLW